MTKFDHHILEQSIKAVSKSFRLNLDSNSPLKDPCNGTYKPLVIAITHRNGGSATRMGMYISLKAFAVPSLICEAARDTCARQHFLNLFLLTAKHLETAALVGTTLRRRLLRKRVRYGQTGR
jgi:hypothetical protein